MLDFVDVKDRLPKDGQEVEVLREIGYYSPTGYCRYAVGRTTHRGRGAFLCDISSTGIVRAWRPAEGVREI